MYRYAYIWASQTVVMVKNQLANAGDVGDKGSIPGLGRFPGKGHDNVLQYSCLENPMNSINSTCDCYIWLCI